MLLTEKRNTPFHKHVFLPKVDVLPNMYDQVKRVLRAPTRSVPLYTLLSITLTALLSVHPQLPLPQHTVPKYVPTYPYLGRLFRPAADCAITIKPRVRSSYAPLAIPSRSIPDSEVRPSSQVLHPRGDLYFLVDGMMFKVHSYFFKRESKIFLDNTTPPDPSTSEETKEDEGRSEDRAIRLLDVSVQDFEKFLWVFYNPKYDIYDADIDWWFSILKLAHKWDFPIVKEFALRELRRRESEIPLVTRIVLYQEFEAPQNIWCLSFPSFCAREYGLTDGETLALGFELACRVWKTREALRNPAGTSPLPSGLTDTDCFSVVSEVMDLPPYPTSTASTAIPETKMEAEDTRPDASEDTAPAPNVKDTDKKKQKQKQKQKELYHRLRYVQSHL
ncbi:hypothetical protein NMY22_g8851 [Coprinellus aureogranulatus]|nr:hypothetical protein NMY22_g8851 [Coprinellus aureogranulatus]